MRLFFIRYSNSSALLLNIITVVGIDDYSTVLRIRNRIRMFLASRIRIHQYDFRIRLWLWILLTSSKNSNKILNSYCLCDFLNSRIQSQSRIWIRQSEVRILGSGSVPNVMDPQHCYGILLKRTKRAEGLLGTSPYLGIDKSTLVEPPEALQTQEAQSQGCAPF